MPDMVTRAEAVIRRYPNRENAIDLDSGAARQIGDADGRARVAAVAAEQLMDEIGSAIDDLRYFVEMRTAIDKAAEANAAGDAIEGSPQAAFNAAIRFSAQTRAAF